MRARLLLALAVSAALASPAAAQSRSDWKTFLEDSYGNYRSSTGADVDWETFLFEAAKAHPEDLDAAVSDFAARIDVRTDLAREFARVIVWSVVDREACGEVGACGLDPESPGVAALARAARQDPSGELLSAVVQNLSYAPLAARAVIFDLVLDHPSALGVLARMRDDSEDWVWTDALVYLAPTDPRTLQALAAGSRRGSDPDAWSGWTEAVLETALDRLVADGAGPDQRAPYVQALLQGYLELGLTKRATDLYLASPETVRGLLPLDPGDCREERAGCRTGRASAAVGHDLAAALWMAGRQDEAEGVLSRTSRRTGAVGGRAAALVEAMRPSRDPATLFALFVDGPPGATAAEPWNREDGAGWIFADYGPAERRLVAERLRGAGYDGMADYLVQRDLYPRWRTEEGLLTRVSARFGPEVARRQAVLKAEIDAAWTRAHVGDEPVADAPVGPSPWTESRLPDGVSPWQEPEGDRFAPSTEERMDSEAGDSLEPEDAALAAVIAADAAATAAAAAADNAMADAEFEDSDALGGPALPPGVAPPIPPDSLLRYGRDGEEHVVLYRSSEFDLPGEIPAYGVWMVRTRQGRWADPVYLGLQERFPYVVTEDSVLPLIADGRLQIEVRARQIDPASITFPPVGLAFSRREDGLVIRADLDALERDADEDGLTDLAEVRLGFDPERADTDGDGVSDGRDPVPLAAFDPHTTPMRDALARAILARLAGYDAGAISVAPDRAPDDILGAVAGGASIPRQERLQTLIMVADPSLFAGLTLPFRLVTYTPAKVARLSDNGAPFYPPRVTVFSSLDEREHLVIWSATWVGGRFRVHCPPDGDACVVEETSNWIT